MDNEAFRALVQERAKPKSTKEIAREAVEEEFRVRKKRKRGGGGSSSEDDSDNDSDREEVPSKQDLLIPTAAKKKARAEHESKYRDRAKERREGKNTDYMYQDQASLLEGVAAGGDDEGQMDQITMSKYLGGDEAHTHLVKGLDVALARRVKREMDKETSKAEVDETNVPAAKQVQKTKSAVVVRDADEALVLLKNMKPESISSELGRQMLSHMKRSYLPSRDLSKVSVRKSPAGLAIQRTSLTFNSLGDPRDRNRAWELPLESMQASVSKPEPNISVTSGRNGATYLDGTLIHQIKLAFDRHGIKSNGNEEHVTKNCHGEELESSDDEIFDDVDDEYVPPTKTESKRGREDNQRKAKYGSIFDGLTAPNSSQSTAIEPSNSVTHEPVMGLEKQVISRDVLGAMPQPSSKSKPKTGVSISSYNGGYGEEMDVDFDSRFADDEDPVGKKRSKSKSTKKQEERDATGT